MPQTSNPFPPAARPEAPPLPPSFSQELQTLVDQLGERPVTLGSILAATQERGFHLLLVFITLPFLTPLPLPGLSTPFGVVVAIIGGCFALGIRPWLPQKLLHRELPPRFLSGLLRAAFRIVKALEFFLQPRLPVLHEHFIFRRVAGALIALSGVYLLLPLPVPFTNTFPAWTVLLLAAGALERDGLFFMAGCFLFVVTTCFFSLIAFGGVHAIEGLRGMIFGG